MRFETKVKEACGVVGIRAVPPTQVAPQIYVGLLALQHRGQESSGICTVSEEGLVSRRRKGLVSNFSGTEIDRRRGWAGIGHVRYSTTGAVRLREAQPFLFSAGNTRLALAFNGTIANYLTLRKELKRERYKFLTCTDTETIAQLLAAKLRKTGHDYIASFASLMEELIGGYSLAVINEKGELFAARDPFGFKPLCLGRLSGESYSVSSESVAFDTMSGQLVRDVIPGEVVKVNHDGFAGVQIQKEARHAHCMFEYVYFSRPDSVIDGRSVYQVRQRLGRKLAKIHPAKADLIIPVPDSGRGAATGFSIESGLPIREGLMKNRYIGRTFIMPTQGFREFSVKLKLNPVRSVVEGKDIILVDDSIVRGTTIKHIVRLLRSVGVGRIHLRISCPQIIMPCYMGIDFPTRRELIAADHSVEEICNFIGADSLGYMSVDGLAEAIEIPREHLCLACLTGDYILSERLKGQSVEALETAFSRRLPSPRQEP